MIGIITAMREEAQHIAKLFDLKATKRYHTIEIFEQNGIVLILTGVGKIQAAIGTTILCQEYQPNQIINIGIAGSLLGNQASIGDVFLIDRIQQHDMYLPFEGSHLDYAKWQITIRLPEYQEIQGVTLHHGGLCLTGDQFIDDADRIQNLASQTQASVVEMEAFAVASVAREFGIEDLIIIKAISDGADSDAKTAHMDNLDFAMLQSCKVLEAFIRQ